MFLSKLKLLSFLGIILIAAGCVSSRQDLLERETFYTQEFDKNYVELANCMISKMHMSERTSGGGSYPLRLSNGQIMNVPNTTTYYRTVNDHDIENKVYYIHDYNQAGLSNVKSWIVVISQIDDTHSKIEIKSKVGLFGNVFEREFPDYQVQIMDCGMQ